MLETFLTQLSQGQGVREALSGIRAAVKDQAAREAAKVHFGNGGELCGLLLAEDAKIRKNAAALIGDLQIEEAARALYEAYEREQTLFVRATLLRALEQTDVYPYLGALGAQYERLCAQRVQEDAAKHIREELLALERILRKEGRDFAHTFTGWDEKASVLLTAYPKFASITAEQITSGRANTNALGVAASVEGLRDIVKIRTFRELLFPIALGGNLFLADGPQAFGEAVCRSKLLLLLTRMHEEGAPFLFRIDLKGGLSFDERGRYIKRAAAVIEAKSERQLVNSPDAYEFELRLLLGKEGKIHLFLKMFTIPMRRFAYRKETISASMQPSLAATFFALAKPYLKEDASVLDPCCGVGTMLIERKRAFPAKRLYAADIFGEAVTKAKVNAAAAGIEIQFMQKDYREFEYRHPFDEIIADLPVRGKRTKQEHDDFYAGFFDKSDELLSPDGILVLYSNERGFVRKQLRLHPVFSLLEEWLIMEKGQFYLYVIGRKG